jgi:predicted nucleic acid-binding protein
VTSSTACWANSGNEGEDQRVAKRLVVEPLAAAGQLARATICDLEVGYSARNAIEWGQLIEDLDAFERIETSATQIHRALQVQRLLAQASQRGRKLPDLLVAAAAENLDLDVLHYDADFNLIVAS